MLRISVEKKLSGILAWGSLGIALLVTDRISTEPVNLGKMLLLTVIAASAITLGSKVIWQFLKANRIILIALSIFLSMGAISIFVSKNPLERGFYGTFGRNTGFLTYLSLALVFVSSSCISRLDSFTKIIKGLLIAGYINIAISLVALAGYEIFKWTNPFDALLGTFGNPNFLAAFMGSFISVLFALLFTKKLSLLHRLFMAISMGAGLFVIEGTKSLQGLVVTALGISITLFFVLKFRFESKLIRYSYSIFVVVASGLAVLGTLQKGPLTGVLYKTSVSLRGEYWQAGINMGINHPFAGVGLDSYGTFYRVFRDKSAIILPGVNTVTDTAHNVFIDIFAGTGVLGLLSYLTLTTSVLFFAIRTFRAQRSYDPLFTAIFVGWVTYQIQSVISINQIGIAIWGWLLGGMIIAYSKSSLVENNATEITKGSIKTKKSESQKNADTTIPAGTLLSLYGAVLIGFMIAFPPFLVDVQLRQAIKLNDKEKLYSVAVRWPMDSTRTNYVLTRSLPQGQEVTESMIKLATIAGKKFPEDYATAFAIYQLSADGSDQRSRYKVKLHRLDPLNPEFSVK
jgi:O-antigen ligase